MPEPKRRGVFVETIQPAPISIHNADWVESKQQGWGEELNQALNVKSSLHTAAVDVLTKRNAEANLRIQQLEQLVDAKDERINKLVDIIIKKLGELDDG